MASASITPLLLAVLATGCAHQADPDAVPDLPAETAFYKKSDAGTDVFKLTSDTGEDRIFYQEPNYCSPDGSKFLFKSDRGDGVFRLYLLDMVTGAIRLLRNSASFGHIPTWSGDGGEVFLGGSGEIIAVDVRTFHERSLKVPGGAWITFLHASPSGDRLLFVEEGASTHEALSVIGTRDGSGYRTLYTLDQRVEYFLDHPAFLDDSTILFLTRGANRDFTGEFNRPYILPLAGEPQRLPLDCSHYDVDPTGSRILCGQEGYVIDRDGTILKEIPGLHGHGTWAPDGKSFLMTGDPVPVPTTSPWFGKIVIIPWNSEMFSLVSHESSYNSSSDPHNQPNAQYTRDGKSILFESDRGTGHNADLYRVNLP